MQRACGRGVRARLHARGTGVCLEIPLPPNPAQHPLAPPPTPGKALCSHCTRSDIPADEAVQARVSVRVCTRVAAHQGL